MFWIVCAGFGGASWWLPGGLLAGFAMTPGILDAWRRVGQERADSKAREAADAEEKAASHELFLDEQRRLAERRAAVRVWSMPEHFPTGTIKRDDELTGQMTWAEAESLFERFSRSPHINWIVGGTSCEARADMMADLAIDQGFRVDKVWATPPEFGVMSSFEGIESRIRLHLDEARTEAISWNFHVAVRAQVNRGQGVEHFVLDPTLFRSPVPEAQWVERIGSGGSDLKILHTSRAAYASPFDTESQTFTIEARNAKLRSGFDLEQTSTREGLDARMRAEFVEGLPPPERKRFLACFQQNAFRQWWQRSSSYERLDEVLASVRYFSVDMTTLQGRLANTPLELRHHTIKSSVWERVAADLRQLEVARDDLLFRRDKDDLARSFYLEFLDLGSESGSRLHRWFHSDAHELWGEFGVALIEG